TYAPATWDQLRALSRFECRCRARALLALKVRCARSEFELRVSRSAPRPSRKPALHERTPERLSAALAETAPRPQLLNRSSRACGRYSRASPLARSDWACLFGNTPPNI